MNSLSDARPVGEEGGPATELVSFIERLRRDLDEVEARMMDLLEISTIRESRNDPDSTVVWVGPSHYWGESDEQQQRLQIPLLAQYQGWYARFRLLLRSVPGDLRKQIEETHAFVLRWIEKESDWDVPETTADAKVRFTEKAQAFRDLLSLYDTADGQELIIVPDTNALIAESDPWGYRRVTGMKDFTVVVLPTVLGELDRLKVQHRDLDFRDKVAGVIRRLKGLRNQGDVLSGVTVHQTVTVRMVAVEPSFEDTLAWLDSSNEDDRILAGVLEVQREHPSAAVILVSGDINLQNKAALAGIPYADLPEERS